MSKLNFGFMPFVQNKVTGRWEQSQEVVKGRLNMDTLTIYANASDFDPTFPLGKFLRLEDDLTFSLESVTSACDEDGNPTVFEWNYSQVCGNWKLVVTV